MGTKIFVTAEGEELTLEDTLIRSMRSITALEKIIKEQDIQFNTLFDRVIALEAVVNGESE
tara:strand:- start:5 stop:187 length:183 start_codon:yes stop_codon:yes gene_type:complete